MYMRRYSYRQHPIVDMYACVCVACANALYVYTYVCTYVRMYVCMYVHMYVCIMYVCI